MNCIKHFLKQALTTMITGLQRPILSVTETYCAIAHKKGQNKRTFNLDQNDVKKMDIYQRDFTTEKRQELPIELILNARIITDLDEIANKFNTYFINIGHSLSEQIHATCSSDVYLNKRTKPVFIFTEVCEECIDSIIKNMKSKSSTGYDNISNKLIKSAKDVLIKPLTFLMNQMKQLFRSN